MAAAVHGRHSRMLVSSSSNTKSSHHHHIQQQHHHQQQQQQQQQLQQQVQQQQSLNTKTNNDVSWNTKELKLLQQSTLASSGSSSSTHHHHQQQQQQQQQQQHHHHHQSPPKQLPTTTTTASSTINVTSTLSSSQTTTATYLTTPFNHHQYSIIQQQQQHQQHIHGCHSKRKSAVELLAESKPFYVKSDTVRDRQQKLNVKGGGGGSSGGGSGITVGVCGVGNITNSTVAYRRSTSSGSDLLQTKLRKLLNTTDSKDDSSIAQKYHSISKHDNFLCQMPKLPHELTVLPDTQSDVSVFFPNAFLSPNSLPHPLNDDLYSYGIDDGLELTDDYCTISPPAEYMNKTEIHRPSKDSFTNNRTFDYGYQRSHSHSQTAVKDDTPEYSPSSNINSHKSLPDLHSQISRHSPHSEALSCCSRGNRSNKSGSSLNRDSGGSSGHYTHHSEPCCKQKRPIDINIGGVINSSSDFRRDSGSSTQHSGNSYYNYGTQKYRSDCIECRNGLMMSGSGGGLLLSQTNDDDIDDCLLNFTTPEVPEAFQDNYNDKSINYYDENINYNNRNILTKLPPLLDNVTSPQRHEHNSPPLGTFKRQKCLRFRNRGKFSTSSNHNNSQQQQQHHHHQQQQQQQHQHQQQQQHIDSNNDIDDRRPILRSKSDISDRYWNQHTLQSQSQSCDGVKLQDNKRNNKLNENMSQLEHYFEHLGLNDETYYHNILTDTINNKLNNSDDDLSEHSSAVYFSDVSTVDSNRIRDSQETNKINNSGGGGGAAVNPAMYRPSEPPSIVERNARIIKWLCNCRKLQLT